MAIVSISRGVLDVIGIHIQGRAPCHFIPGEYSYPGRVPVPIIFISRGVPVPQYSYRGECPAPIVFQGSAPGQ